jgi:hypothetical protein
MKITGEIIVVYSENHTKHEYSRNPIIWNNWDGEISGYVESPDNWIFFK